MNPRRNARKLVWGSLAFYYPRMDLPSELLDQLLAQWPVGRLASVSASGAPHSVPLVFCALDGVIYSPLDGKRKASSTLRRFENVAANPATCLLLDGYEADWERLWWVQIDARADRYQPNSDADRQLREVLVMRTGPLNMFVYGSVNLATEKLDLSLATQASRGIGISAATITNPCFKVGGALSAPAPHSSQQAATGPLCSLSGNITRLYDLPIRPAVPLNHQTLQADP